MWRWKDFFVICFLVSSGFGLVNGLYDNYLQVDCLLFSYIILGVFIPGSLLEQETVMPSVIDWSGKLYWLGPLNEIFECGGLDAICLMPILIPSGCYCNNIDEVKRWYNLRCCLNFHLHRHDNILLAIMEIVDTPTCNCWGGNIRRYAACAFWLQQVLSP